MSAPLLIGWSQDTLTWLPDRHTAYERYARYTQDLQTAYERLCEIYTQPTQNIQYLERYKYIMYIDYNAEREMLNVNK